MTDPKFDRIYQQIDATADYYEPSVYSILGGSDAFLLEDDPIGEDFVPVSPAVLRGGQEVKKFVVGILPPSSNVTGRLLDRSNSVAAIVGANFTDITTGNRSHEKQLDKENFKWTDLSDDFWLRWVEMCERLGVEPDAMAAIFYNESQFNPYEAAGPANDPNRIVARGLGMLIKSVAHIACVSEDDWYNFQDLSGEEQLPYWEQFLKKSRVRGKGKQDLYVGHFGYVRGNPEGILYASQGYMDANPDDFKDLKPGERALNARAYDQNCGADGLHSKLATGGKIGGVVCGKNSYAKGYIGLEDLGAAVAGLPPFGVTAKIQAAQKRSEEGAYSGAGSNPTDALPCNQAEEDGTSNWQDGSAEANYIRSLQNSLADTGILSGKQIASMFTAAQTQMIKKTRAELERMKNTPPLRMLIAPQKFSVSDEKIVADGNYGRYGPIVEHWGDNQGKIEASGKIAGFYAVDKYGGPQYNASVANLGYTETTGLGGPGLSRTIRNFSQSYQNFMSLWLLYRNNGGLWLEFESFSTSQKYQNLSAVGSIWIYYDNIIYFGSFDSFSITETDTAPFTLEYNFSFTVRASFVLDRVADPGMNYNSKYLVGANPNELPAAPFAPPTNNPIDPDSPTARQARGMLEVATADEAALSASKTPSGRRAASRGPKPGTVPTPKGGKSVPAVTPPAPATVAPAREGGLTAGTGIGGFNL